MPALAKQFSLAMLMAAPLLAGAAENNWYLAADLGQSQFDLRLPTGYSTSTPGVSKRSTDTAYYLGGGYRVTPNFAIEAGYQNLGEYKLSYLTSRASAEVDGISASAVFQLPVSDRWQVFAKAGALFASAKSSIRDTSTGSSASQTKNGLVPVVGIGVSYTVDKQWSIRAQYQDIGAAKAAEAMGYRLKLSDQLLSLGAAYQF